MILNFEGLLARREEAAGLNTWMITYTLTPGQAKTRARKLWKAARLWSDGEPRFALRRGLLLDLINPKRNGMVLTLRAEVFGIRSGNYLQIVDLKYEYFT